MKIAFVSSKGGHLGQIKIIFTNEVLKNHHALLITETEDKKKQGTFEDSSFLNKYRTYYFKKDLLLVPNPISYLKTLFALKKIFQKEKIDCIVTNGAQISIPAVIAAKLSGIKAIFIDTVIRVKTPDWSARASYPFSDIFLVQHPHMAKKYGKKAKYEGGIL